MSELAERPATLSVIDRLYRTRIKVRKVGIYWVVNILRFNYLDRYKPEWLFFDWASAMRKANELAGGTP